MATQSYKKKQATLHGKVLVATKTSIKELNKQLKKENKNKLKKDKDGDLILEHDLADAKDEVLKFKELIDKDRKPVVIKRSLFRSKK